MSPLLWTLDIFKTRKLHTYCFILSRILCCANSAGPGAGLDLWVAVLEQLDDLESKGLMASSDLRYLGTTLGWRRLEDLRSLYNRTTFSGLLYEENSIIIIHYYYILSVVLLFIFNIYQYRCIGKFNMFAFNCIFRILGERQDVFLSI